MSTDELRDCQEIVWTAVRLQTTRPSRTHKAEYTRKQRIVLVYANSTRSDAVTDDRAYSKQKVGLHRMTPAREFIDLSQLRAATLYTTCVVW